MPPAQVAHQTVTQARQVATQRDFHDHPWYAGPTKRLRPYSQLNTGFLSWLHRL